MSRFNLRIILGLVCIFSINCIFANTEENDTVQLPSYEMLDEVVIQVEKPVVQSDGAKTTYNVDSDPSAGSSTALDILKKVPMVSVDGEGKVRLNGESNFKFQLNGQENPMLSQYADKILQGMPATAIVKIEVITEPGATQDAEGAAGIINIITERAKSQDGYSGNIRLGMNSQSLGPSLYAILKNRNVTLSANVDYQWGWNGMKNVQQATTHYLTEDNPGYLNFETSQTGKFQYVGASLNMSWEPNVRNLFNVSSNVSFIDGSSNNLLNSNTRFNERGNVLWSFLQNGNAALNMLNLSASTSYRHNFSLDSKNYLIISYLLNFGINRLSINQWLEESLDYDALDLFNYRNSKAINRGQTVQLDYAKGWNEDKHLIEVGAKGIFRFNSALSGQKSAEFEEELNTTPGIQTYIMQPQNIYAGYASYTGKFGNLTGVAGLRYEHTLMGVDYRPSSPANFRTHLNDWVPNAAITYNFTGMSNLRIGYQMRISRPSIDQVNPFRLSLSPFQEQTGNPDLTSERSNKVSLTYSNFGRIFGGNIGLEYTTINNAISNVTYLENRQFQNVLVSTFANIGKKNSGALSGFLNWNIISKMSLSINGRLAYDFMKAPSMNVKNQGWTGNIGGAWNYTVADKYKFSAYGQWFARRIDLQGNSSGFYYYGLSASRDFLKDNSLNISVSANNFCQKSMSFKSHISSSDMITDSKWTNMRAWNVGFSISWKFGALNTQVKKTGVEIDNNDINTTTNNSNGQNSAL